MMAAVLSSPYKYLTGKSTIMAIKTFGSSMTPFLRDNDVIYLKKKRVSSLKVNDIVCIKKNKKKITHRIIYKNLSYIITKGDNNKVSDGKIKPQNIVGVIYKVKRGKFFFNPDQIYLMQSTLYFQEIIKINTIMRGKKVDFVFLKGLPLYLHWEGTPPKRFYFDCDVLINHNSFPTVVGILKNLGYSQVDNAFSHTLRRIKQHEVEISFYKIINNIPVVFDIHLEVVFLMTQVGRLNNLYPYRYIKELTYEFLREKRDITIENEKLPILSSNNFLLYLLLHLFHHNFKGSYRYDLISLLFKTYKFNYKVIAMKINKYKLEGFIFPSLILLKKYYKINIPKFFMDFTNPNPNLKKIILNIDIFSEYGRLEEGIQRFKNIFFFSPLPLPRKLITFCSPSIIYTGLWIFAKNLRLFHHRLFNTYNSHGF